MTQKIDEKLVFAASTDEEDGPKFLIVGIPKDAWEYMKDGKTHNFDLTKIGIPLKLMLFGGDNHDAVKKVLTDALAAQRRAYLDKRNEDFSIKD